MGLSHGELENRRRRARFRSWHRGTREMDLVLGNFADAQIDTLNEDELAIYEDLMEAPDTELFKWVSGERPTPANYDTEIFRRIRAFFALRPEAHS